MTSAIVTLWADRETYRLVGHEHRHGSVGRNAVYEKQRGLDRGVTVVNDDVVDLWS